MSIRGTVGSSIESHRAISSHPDRRNFIPQTDRLPSAAHFSGRLPQLRSTILFARPAIANCTMTIPFDRRRSPMQMPFFPLRDGFSPSRDRFASLRDGFSPLNRRFSPISRPRSPIFLLPTAFAMACSQAGYVGFFPFPHAGQRYAQKTAFFTPLNHENRVLGFRRPGNALRQSEPNLVEPLLSARTGRPRLRATFSAVNSNNK